ncbi:type VI secretion system baseplate subunit TssG [Massilia terrae]|uniref:Type VI secretion system baseplate subunit TssG n=1 Tax=Massilia terrae TaxID=1811224 RepID=A0ABT2CSS8_9BURK|nr:type VI secretion system baseplate subunit TssG [Massilia terrae]MCS0657022.1 type VI secretion system baseplate subunit TssG [Massilia terrae]
MRTAKRRFEPAVIERLFKEPYRFRFFQAVRLIELWLRRRGVTGDVSSYLRFQNSMSLSFPASELEAICVEPAGAAPAELRYIRITPSFMGFLGGRGALPVHYTERLAQHQLYQRDDGPRAFLDALSNRSLLMFYEAWRKYRLEFKCQADGRDQFLPLLLSLAGMGGTSLRGRLAADGIRDESLAHFAAALRHRPASAAQMARVLSAYFGQPISIGQFSGAWYEVPHAQQTTLGGADAVLGAGALAGSRVWQRDLRLLLTVGPLDYSSFDAFLPGGPAARALRGMLSMFTGAALEYEVEVVLRAAEVRNAALRQGEGGRLGWDAFLVRGPQTQDRRDVRYLLPD